MHVKTRLSVLVGILCLSASVASAQRAALRNTDALHAGEMAQLDKQYSIASMTVRSVKSGAWSDPDTWDVGVPSASARVLIANGQVVTVDTTTAAADVIRVEGTLRFDPARMTALAVETLYGTMASRIEIGTAKQPILLPQTATLTIRSSGQPFDHAVDPFEFGRGLVTMGLLEAHGQPLTAWVPTSREYPAGASTLVLDRVPEGWQPGDRLLVTAAHFGQDETRTIAGISGSSVTLNAPLTFARAFPKTASPRPPFAFHVGNLTRNVNIQTDPKLAGQIGQQGHVMLMHRGGHQIRYVGFRAVGRTHVNSPVTDPMLVDGKRNPQLMPICGADEENVRGRYGLHFHMALPTSEASIVQGIALEAVRNSGLRIGVQNHSSHVRLTDSVIYQVDGFGLFTEEGDERGQYNRNLVVYGKGHDASLHEDVRDNCMERNGYGDIMSRRRLAVGWRGGGIWLHGGQVDVVGNVIANTDNVGIDIWERPLQHMACVIHGGCNTYAVLYPTALLREGNDWVPAKFTDLGVENSVPPFLVTDNQLYGIGGPGKNRSRSAFSLHYMKIWEKWADSFPGRPRNLLARNLAWNVANGIATTYTEYARVEGNTFIQGDLLESNLHNSLSDLVGSAIKMNAQGGEQFDYVRNRIEGFQEGIRETPSSCYIDNTVDGQTFKPSQFPSRTDCAGGTTEPPPPVEICGDKIDNDGDGQVDEGCPVIPPPAEICGNGIDDDGDGQVDEGCPVIPPPAEVCGDGIDNDGDGQIDEGCPVVPPPPTVSTVVSIQGTKFLINGTVTYPGTSVEGMLLNSRMVQATFDDENSATVGNWVYPDTKKWDAERNVSEFIAQLPNYRAKGLLGVTINLQGGGPGPWGGDAQPNITTAFNADGSLKPAWMDRTGRVIDAADAQGMVVILGYFYFGQDHRLANEAAVIAATDNVTDWLLERGYRNVLVEVNNESNVAYDHDILRPARVPELITRVRERSKGQLLVSTSFGGGFVPTDAVVAASDFVLTHGNQLQVAEITQRVALIRGLPSYKAKPSPIVFNEGHSLLDRFNAAVAAGASWGYYHQGANNYNDGFQSPPVNWTIQPGTRKQTFFDRVEELTGGQQPPPPVPVDCVVSEWMLQSASEWSACSAEGSQTRTEQWVRTVITQPANGGAACPALAETRIGTQSCVPPPVPVDCVVSEFGPWSEWAPVSATEEQRSRSRTILVPPANGGAACPVLSETESRPIVVIDPCVADPLTLQVLGDPLLQIFVTSRPARITSDPLATPWSITATDDRGCTATVTK